MQLHSHSAESEDCLREVVQLSKGNHWLKAEAAVAVLGDA